MDNENAECSIVDNKSKMSLGTVNDLVEYFNVHRPIF